MVDLFTYKSEEDPNKNEGTRVVTTMLHYPSIFKMLKARPASFIIGDGILMKLKLIRAFIVIHLICKNKYDLFKFESTGVVTTFLPI